MRPRIATLLAAAALGAAIVVPATPSAALEPYDSQTALTLVDPGPGFTEITDPADPGRSGPLDAARLDALDVQLPAQDRGVLLGGAVRGFASSTNRVIELGYALVDADHARSSLSALPAVGEPIDVPGIPGAVGRATEAPVPVAYVAFALGSRSYFVVVGGPDPGHALLQDTALQVVNTAAEVLAGELTAGLGGGDLGAADATPSTGTATPSDELGARVRRALGHRDVRLGLAAFAGALLYVLARRNRPAPRQLPTNPYARNSGHAWRQATTTAWTTPSGEAPTMGAATDPFTPTPRVPLGGPVASGGAATATYDSGWGAGDVGWGDEEHHAAPADVAAPAPILPPPAAVPTAAPIASPTAGSVPAPWTPGLTAGPNAGEAAPPLPVRRPGGGPRREASPIFSSEPSVPTSPDPDAP